MSISEIPEKEMTEMEVSSGLLTASQPRPGLVGFTVAAPKLANPTCNNVGLNKLNMLRMLTSALLEKTTLDPTCKK